MTGATERHDEDQFQTLLDTVERLRVEHFPTLDAGLVREILQLHASGSAADSGVLRRIEQAVDNSLSKD